MRLLLQAPAILVIALAASAGAAGERDHVADIWNGPYIGGHVSLQSTTSRWQAQALGAMDTGSSLIRARDGQFGPVLGGFQVGGNKIFHQHFLFGLEADVTFPNEMRADRPVYSSANGVYLVEDKVEAFGSMRARAGFASENLLAYVTGGAALAHHRLERTQYAGAPFGAVVGPGDSDTLYRWKWGFALGAGAELRLSSNWSAKLEYLYFRFPTSGMLFPLAVQQYASDNRAHSLRLGLNYLVGNRREPTEASWFDKAENWNIHGQMTGIAQNAFAFPALYWGPKSLDRRSQLRDTVSWTAFIGTRLPTGTEIYFNPEPTQGFGLSRTQGIGGFPNNEAQKGGSSFPRYNTARLFARHVFGLGGEQEEIEDGPNQLPGKVDVSRLTVTVGKMQVIDLFDNNAYSHDGRTSFMNWSLVDAGAFDWSADQKGYTWGAVAELNQRIWAVRAGYFLPPSAPNGFNYDTRLGRRGQFIGEFEGRYSLLGQSGKLRLASWMTRSFTGNFDEALSNPVYGGDVSLTRRTRTSRGFIANLEHTITEDIGVFARLSWRTGGTEIMAWTDIDKSASFGAVLKGSAWGRGQDKVGVAVAVNGLSNSYRSYLASGGAGINIGDGALNYRRERVLEGYYSFGLLKSTWLTLDYQHVSNPAYNADRGPVSIASVRFHTEF